MYVFALKDVTNSAFYTKQIEGLCFRLAFFIFGALIFLVLIPVSPKLILSKFGLIILLQKCWRVVPPVLSSLHHVRVVMHKLSCQMLKQDRAFLTCIVPLLKQCVLTKLSRGECDARSPLLCVLPSSGTAAAIKLCCCEVLRSVADIPEADLCDGRRSCPFRLIICFCLRIRYRTTSICGCP
jgi:hypothetical protein